VGTAVAYYVRSNSESVKNASNSPVFTPVVSQGLTGLVVGGSF